MSHTHSVQPPAIITSSHSIPTPSLLAGALARIDYADTYTIAARLSSPPSIDDLATLLFGKSPAWVSALMGLRDAIVAPLGLKTSAALTGPRAGPAPGERIAIFRVIGRNADELLLGEDDRHLNFRVGVIRRMAGDQMALSVTTIVQFNNMLGRLYFLPVRPFHVQIVRRMMRSAARQLGQIADTQARQ